MVYRYFLPSVLMFVSCFLATNSIATPMNASVDESKPEPSPLSPISSSTEKTIPEIPSEILTIISAFTDKNTSLVLGQSSKAFNLITEQRNSRNRLSLLLQHCDAETFLDLTSNGYFLFRNSISTLATRSSHPLHTLKRDTRCNQALMRNVRTITHRITHLTLRLPSLGTRKSLEVDTALNAYFDSVEALLERKSTFEKVSVLGTSEWEPVYLYKGVEERLFNVLSRITMKELVLRVNVQQPKLLMHPTLSKLTVPGVFYETMDDYSGIPNLSSIVISGLYVTKEAFAKIAKTAKVKAFSVPQRLAIEALSEPLSIDTLNVLAPPDPNPEELISALMNTPNPLTQLGLHTSLPVSDVSRILKKFKPTLRVLIVHLEADSRHDWEPVLNEMLSENALLKTLRVSVRGGQDLNHTFLETGSALHAYSYSGFSPTHSLMPSLWAFLSAQVSLRTLTLEFESHSNEEDFFTFLDGLVSAIRNYPTLTSIQLKMGVKSLSIPSFFKKFSVMVEPLCGRGLTLNTVPIENVVSDLENGLEKGLHWKIRGNVHLG